MTTDERALQSIKRKLGVKPLKPVEPPAPPKPREPLFNASERRFIKWAVLVSLVVFGVIVYHHGIALPVMAQARDITHIADFSRACISSELPYEACQRVKQASQIKSQDRDWIDYCNTEYVANLLSSDYLSLADINTCIITLVDWSNYK
jgi:hypothetical protein